MSDLDLASTPTPPGVSPFDPDAPLQVLLSVRENPLLATATREQLLEFAQRTRQLAVSPPALSAAIRATVKREPRQSNSVAARKRSILDSI